MSNLQYIGARYVPKFYLNPDDSSNDWKSGVLYEALTIVTYNNDSYTSKKTVPATIGDPASNPEYWACTTKYTAALVSLQSSLGQVESDVDDLNKLRSYVTPQMFGAKGDGINDDTSAIQDAIDFALANNIGGVHVPSGTYITTAPIILTRGVNLIGENVENTIIKKKTNGTKNVTVYAPNYLTDVYIDGSVPSNINCILALTGVSGRYCGIVSDIHFTSELSNPSDHESQIVDIGIISLGSLSDFSLINCHVSYVRHAFLVQIVYVSKFLNNRVDHCLRGFGINSTSTSLLFSGNYVLRARDYGYYICSTYYSLITNNACDTFNYPNYYPDRTVQRSAYVFRSCIGDTIINNGIEACIGICYHFINCKECTIESNTALSVGSDYSGAGDIAFLYFNPNLQRCTIKNNFAWLYNPNGLTFGSADPAKHHNIYFEGFSYVLSNEIENNIFRSSADGALADEGWGNNNALNINANSGGSGIETFTPVIKAETMGDLDVTYGPDNKHYVERKGKFMHVFGCFDITVNYTTASGYFLVDNFPTNSSTLWFVGVDAVRGGGSLAKTPKNFFINAGTNGGVVHADDESNMSITAIPSGTHFYMYYDGTYLSNYAY